MYNSGYYAPASLEDALGTLACLKEQATIIAGGTDLVPRIQAGEIDPKTLVDLRRLPLKYIRDEGDFICLGSCLTHTDILDATLLGEHFPALLEACREIGGTQVRNRGTIGGNLANASPAADLAPPLLVYDAMVVLASSAGQRTVPLQDFFRGSHETVLRIGELLTEVKVPKMPARTSAAFIKLGIRHSMAIALVSVAVRLSLDSGAVVREARIAMGSVAPTPKRARTAEGMLLGKSPNGDVVAKAALEASKEASPISDLRAGAEYRRKMTEVVVSRALRSTCINLLPGDKTWTNVN